QDASRLIAWNLLENRDRLTGRLYGYNAAFGKLAPVVLDALADQLNISLSSSLHVSEEDDEFSLEIDPAETEKDYGPLFQAFKSVDRREESIDALIEASESAIEREKGKASAGAALKTVSQAHAKLAGVDVTG